MNTEKQREYTQEELEVREVKLKTFTEELIQLCELHKCGIIAKPFIDEEGKISAQPIIILVE